MSDWLFYRDVDIPEPCTGEAASWCRYHGNCSCEQEKNDWSNSVRDQEYMYPWPGAVNCPLHSLSSAHNLGDWAYNSTYDGPFVKFTEYTGEEFDALHVRGLRGQSAIHRLADSHDWTVEAFLKRYGSRSG